MFKPFVACHETAHSMGYGAEDEANFIGFISASESDNPMLKRIFSLPGCPGIYV